MPEELRRNFLPAVDDVEEVIDIEIIEPPLPRPNYEASGGEGGELAVAAFPFSDGLYRLRELLKQYPILKQESELSRAIELTQEIQRIIGSLPTREYVAPVDTKSAL